MSRRLHRICTQRADEGFSLPELLVVLLVGGVLAAIALATTKSAVTTLNSSSAMDTLKARLNVAREAAISRQRDVVVTFVGTNVVRFFVVNPDATQTQIDEARMEGDVTFTTFAGQGTVNDPQVPWCNDGANAFRILNGIATLRFNSDGALINSANRQIVSGCLYIGKPGSPATARALSVFGTTGRSRAFNFANASAGWSH